MAKPEMPLWQKVNKPLASLKLAVFVILAMGMMSAWGTIVESQYNDARRAQELVYHSWYSYGIFFLLSVNLIAVMVDRWPWKKKHIGFINAHVGILILIMGSIFTRYFGVDGSMSVDIGGRKGQVLLPYHTDILIYAGVGSGDYRTVYEQEVNFMKAPPTEANPWTLKLPGADIKVDKYDPYSMADIKVSASEEDTDGPALRFQMANDRVKETQWIVSSGKAVETLPLGPAQVVLAKKGLFRYSGGNVLLLEHTPGSETLDFSVYTGRLNKKTTSGAVKAGEVVETGWMGLTFRLLKFLPHARRKFEFQSVARSGDGVGPSIRVWFNGKEHWMALNSNLKFFTDSAVYYFGYVNRMLPLGFDIGLKDFKVGRYKGTGKAASYASDVFVLDEGQKLGPIHIAMNEPLHHKGFTFYQASFSQDETGRETASVFSVNKDPGRPWKYLGSLMIVIGIFDLFYIRRKRSLDGANRQAS